MTDLQYWAQIAQNASLILAAFIAIFGIDAWRREYVGKRHMELAEEVLALFYQARDAIREIRNPVGYEGEGQSRKAASNESPNQKRNLDAAFVAIERYQRHVELFSRLHTLRYRFMALVGKDASKPFDDLASVIGEIHLAARCLARYWTREGDGFVSEAERDSHREKIRKSETIYWSGEDNDHIEAKVDALLARIEQTCRGILTSKGTLFGLINLPLRGGDRG